MIRDRINLDGLGILTSIACAIHCAILPLLIGTLPILGINIIHNPAFESFMILMAFCIGSISLVNGFRKNHGRRLPLFVFLAGILFLLARQFWHEYELLLLPFAIMLIIYAHFTNLKLSRLATQKIIEPGASDGT